MEYIEFKKKHHIGTITLNRTDTGNLFNGAFTEELTDVCRQIKDDQDIWVVILTGARGAFSSGNNLAGAEYSTTADLASKALADLLVPIIAAINGDAIGAGLELALVADIRLAAEGTKFALPQVSQGAIPAGGGTQRLPRIVGRGKGLEMILTAETLDAAEAYRIGLVNRVLPAAELMAYAENMASKIASKGPIAERYSKESINKGLDMSLGQGLRLEGDLSFLLQSTKDRAEGIDAFLKKRTPEFRGE